MNKHVASGEADGRPYRSHRVPACSVCRKRKIHCEKDHSARACRFCLERQLVCDSSYGKQQLDVGTPREEASRSRATISNAVFPATTVAGEQIRQTELAPTSPPSDSSPLLMNPTMAEDVDITERYLTSNAVAGSDEARPYIHVSHAGGESIVYHRVPRLRKGLSSAIDAGKTQREILEQVLGTFQTDVIKLYFDHIHPCFPILDEAGFWELWQKDASRLSSALICDIYALALLYWGRSERLQSHPRPDIFFAWNQAVTALRDDFMAPSITTLYAVLLDLGGRPVLSVAINVINIGRMVTLSHSLGLHRDPSTWKMTESEKSLRIRLWWGVLIHDLWYSGLSQQSISGIADNTRSSLSHGTPPNIHSSNHDVPLPSAITLTTGAQSEPHKKASMSFVHLCSLTQTLEHLLPLVYTLHPNPEDSWKTIRKIEYLLDEWEGALPSYLNVKAHDSDNTRNANGASNLWFCFLSLKLLLHRVSFRVTLSSDTHLQREAKHYRLALLRDSASAVVEYVISLQPEQLHQFWLPYTAHLLVSATVVLLRCTVESSNKTQMREGSQKLLKLLSHLRTARELYEWDLADFCLERCTMPIERIAASVVHDTSQAELEDGAGNGPSKLPASDALPLEESNLTTVEFLDDLFLPTDSLDYPWEMLWDNVEGLWHDVV